MARTYNTILISGSAYFGGINQTGQGNSQDNPQGAPQTGPGQAKHDNSNFSGRGRGRGGGQGRGRGGRANYQASRRGRGGFGGAGNARGGRGWGGGSSRDGAPGGRGCGNQNNAQSVKRLANLPSPSFDWVTPPIPQDQVDEFVEIVRKHLVLSPDALAMHATYTNLLTPRSEDFPRGLGLGGTRDDMDKTRFCQHEQCGLSGHEIQERNAKCRHHARTIVDAQDVEYCTECRQNSVDVMPGCREYADGHDMGPPSAEFIGKNFLPTSNPNARKIVAWDSEHILKWNDEGKTSHDSFASWLCFVDCLTGEVLLHCYVFPKMDLIRGTNKDSSGITWGIARNAIREGNCYRSHEELTAAMSEFCSQETVLVGWATWSDLKAQKLIHSPNMVDLQLAASPYYGSKDYPGLANTVAKQLRIAIQQHGQPHSPVEDAFATREMFIHCVRKIQAGRMPPGLIHPDPYADSSDDEW